MTAPHCLFTDREEAGWMLVDHLRSRPLHRPLVLAIPRGGIEVGVPLARGLGAELDVVLSRKLRSPRQPELALGAVAEDGSVSLNHFAHALTDVGDAFIEAERRRQMEEIARRRRLYRAVRPAADPTDRSVIVTDDGIATGATMIAALRTVRAARPRELIVAIPVAPTDRLEALRPACDLLVCLHSADDFWAVGQFYRHFDQVEDERVVELLRDEGLPGTKWLPATSTAGV